MSTKAELNTAGTAANAKAETSIATARKALSDGYDVVTQAYVEGHIGGGDAAELRDAYDVALGRLADAMEAVRKAHKLGTRVAVKADPGLKPTGTYADLPPLNEGVGTLGGGR